MQYNDRMVATLLADHERWTKREAAEIASRAKGSTVVDPYCRDRNITGVPTNHHRQVKASPNSWDSMARPKWDSTVKVTRDGITVYAPRSVFRKEKGMRGLAKQHAERQHHMTAADMAPVQDYENDN